MKTLGIDIETYSSIDLKTCGVYRYVEAPDFEILLFAYAWDGGPVEVVDLMDFEDVPADVMAALTDPAIIKTAFNANFERTCIAKHFNTPMDPTQWRCTAVHALTLGLPGYLDGVANVMNLEAQKDAKGKNLIKYFSVPCKATKKNEGRTRNYPHHDMEKWQEFKDYCGQDVEVERAARNKMIKHPTLRFEDELWAIDQHINDRGVHLDKDLVKQAIRCDELYQEQLMIEAKEITELENPNSVAQLKAWLQEQTGEEVTTLNKETVPLLIDKAEHDDVKRVLELRQEMARTSIKKYLTMNRAVCDDGRVRGLLQFYGANRTGRWAGRLVQVQNLRKNELPDLQLARDLLKAGEFEQLELLFGDVPDVLSQLIRTAFTASPDCRLIVSDYSAIEARVIAWLAGESWRLKVFNGHGKIYEASASAMFNVPIESIDKGNPLRQKGKIAELALGYQGAKGALITMGALNMGLSEEELPDLVKTWRAANQNIVKFWYEVEACAVAAVKEKRSIGIQHGIYFSYQDGGLFIRLPSGRKLSYVRPRIEKDERFNKDKLTYEGVGDQGRWERLDTYGGKLVENIVQAVARDCLAVGLVRLEEAGYNQTIMHVHDEVVLDVPKGQGSLDEVNQIMGEPIIWAKDLPLAAEGFETQYYMKD